MKDAVITVCCHKSFCDECIRNKLLETELHECPHCKKTKISPADGLVPNENIRKVVENFRSKNGYLDKKEELPPGFTPHNKPVIKLLQKNAKNSPSQSPNSVGTPPEGDSPREDVSSTTQETPVSTVINTIPTTSVVPTPGKSFKYQSVINLTLFMKKNKINKKNMNSINLSISFVLRKKLKLNKFIIVHQVLSHILL